jgi:hypothetical protein
MWFRFVALLTFERLCTKPLHTAKLLSAPCVITDDFISLSLAIPTFFMKMILTSLVGWSVVQAITHVKSGMFENDFLWIVCFLRYTHLQIFTITMFILNGIAMPTVFPVTFLYSTFNEFSEIVGIIFCNDYFSLERAWNKDVSRMDFSNVDEVALLIFGNVGLATIAMTALARWTNCSSNLAILPWATCKVRAASHAEAACSLIASSWLTEGRGKQRYPTADTTIVICTPLLHTAIFFYTCS